MELIDVLNEKGEQTGEVYSRVDVHAKGLWHKAVHIWILNSKGELLLQKRSLTKESNPGQWDISVAGHLSAGESSVDGAKKEISEEIGLEVEDGELILIGKITQSSLHKNGTYINNEFNDVYVFKKDIDLTSIRLQPEEVSEVVFVSLQELEQRVKEKDETLVKHDKEYQLLFNYLHTKKENNG
jgi:isopentenyldiphosphate isomerase